MILASIGEHFGGNGWLVLMVIVFLGTRQWCKWLKGNALVRGAAKKGVLSILGRMFK
jgi:hypothetical protein